MRSFFREVLGPSELCYCGSWEQRTWRTEEGYWGPWFCLAVSGREYVMVGEKPLMLLPPSKYGPPQDKKHVKW